jgi:hypothetical protein
MIATADSWPIPVIEFWQAIRVFDSSRNASEREQFSLIGFLLAFERATGPAPAVMWLAQSNLTKGSQSIIGGQGR